MTEVGRKSTVPVLLLETEDGLLRDIDGRIAVSATGLKNKIEIALPLLRAFREGRPLPPQFASLRELLSSFGDEPMYVRQTGEFLPSPTLEANEVVMGHSIVTINVPTKRLVALVAAILALDVDLDVGDIGWD